MIINIVYSQKKIYDITIFENEVRSYGDVFVTDKYTDDEGMVHGTMLLAFGGTDFNKVYFDLYSKFYEFVSFIGYKVTEVYTDTGRRDYDWVYGYFGNRC